MSPTPSDHADRVQRRLTAQLRTAGCVGLVAAAVLVVNASRRAGVLPTGDATRAVAPLAEMLGLLLLMAVFVRYYRRLDLLGSVGFALNAVGLVGVAGIEYVLNYVFPGLTHDQQTILRSGLLGAAFTATSVVFLAGVLTFAAALWRSTDVARWVLVAYVLGFTLVSIRSAIPEGLLQVALLIGAASMVGLARPLLRPPT